MRDDLLVQHPLESGKQAVKLFGLDHGPRDDCKLPSMESTDEICLLFCFNDVLKLETESVERMSSLRVLKDRNQFNYSLVISFLSESTTS